MRIVTHLCRPLVVLFLFSAAAKAVTVSFTVDPTQNNSPISPYIYGSNGMITGVNNTFYRFGGNRYTAYNWATNWSNAGSDYLYENDTYMGSPSNGPAWPYVNGYNQAVSLGAGTLATFQLAGYVAGDAAGPVASANYVTVAGGTSTRFIPALYPKPGAPASYSFPPSQTSGMVYDDEMMAYLVKTLGSAANGGIQFYDLDNEPGLWSTTHIEVHNYPVTYAEVSSKGIAMATLAKSIDPNAKIIGPVSSCWSESMSLFGAPDSSSWNAIYNNGNWVPYLNYYLAMMKAASASAGVRLLDYLDWHAYPEDTDSAGNQISNDDVTESAAVCRMQTPRDLWDPTYTPNLWISCCVSSYGPIMLIPRLQGAVAQYYPGTNIAFDEYGYGAYTDILGGIAEADFLGILGQRPGMLASVWASGTQNYLADAFNLYLNYDGSGSHFGTTSVLATSNNVPEATVYAAKDSAHPNRLNVIILNKDYSNNNTASVTFNNLGGTIISVRSFQFNSVLSAITVSNTFGFNANTLTDTLPFRSATLYELTCSFGTATPTNSPTASPSPASTSSPSATPSPSASPTGTVTASPSPTATFARTATATETDTQSPSPSQTPSATQTPPFSATATGSITLSQTATPVYSVTSSPSSTASASASPCPTAGLSSTVTLSTVPSPTATATDSAIPSATLSAALTPCLTPTQTQSSTAASTVTGSSTPTPGPFVFSLSPISGPRGVTVTVSGSGFLPGSEVLVGAVNGVGGVQAQILAATGTSLTVVMPDLSGTVQVLVENPLASGEDPSNGVSFTYTSAKAPTPTLPTGGNLVILRAVPVPNPDPSNLALDLGGTADGIKGLLFSVAENAVYELSWGPQAAGWSRLTLPAAVGNLAPGLYYLRLQALRGDAVSGPVVVKVVLLR